MTVTWPSNAEQAIAEQLRLQDQVSDVVPAGFAPRTAAGLDVHYDGDEAVGAVVVLDLESLAVIDQAWVRGPVGFPYVPGLFAFRELPLLLPALARLETTPDVLVCDGQGIAHPRRFGLACHAGVLAGIPSIGVSGTPTGCAGRRQARDSRDPVPAGGTRSRPSVLTARRPHRDRLSRSGRP